MDSSSAGQERLEVNGRCLRSAVDLSKLMMMMTTTMPLRAMYVTLNTRSRPVEAWTDGKTNKQLRIPHSGVGTLNGVRKSPSV